MKPYAEYFQDSIDMTDSSVTMTEKDYKAIQLDAWKSGMADAANIVNECRGEESDLRCVRDRIKSAASERVEL